MTIQLTTQEKKIIKMRGNGEKLEDIADHFNIELDIVKAVFPKVADQVRSAEDTAEVMKILNETPYDKTRKAQRRMLDEIDKRWLVEYVLEYFPDETREALRERDENG